MDALERRILRVTCFGHFMSHFNMLVFPALLLPLSEHLSMDMADALGISFWMYLLFGITALPWGVAVDRWGAKPFLLLFYSGAGLSSLAAALWMDSPAALSLALAALGLFSGIYHPTGLGWISRGIERVGHGMASHGMFGSLGVAVAPLLTGVVNWLWGPRATYLVLGGLNLLGVGLMLAAPRTESPRPRALRTREGNGMLGAFLILLVAMTLGGIAYRGATVILPAYFELNLQRVFRWMSSLAGGKLSQNVVANTATSFIYLGGILGQYTGGRMAERFELKRCYLVFNAVVIPIALLMSVTVDLPLVALGTLYFFFLLGMQPIENTLVARFTPRRFHHAAYGTKFTLTFGVGALAVKMIETVKVHWGLGVVFPSLGMVSLALAGTIVLLIYKTPRLRS